jgi:DNA-binding transcriptional regulator YdaS (Cro superfamily)
MSIPFSTGANMSPSKMIDTLGGTAAVARLCKLRMSTVSDWKHLDYVPQQSLFLIAYPLEVATNGKVSRKKLFPEFWEQVWPELKDAK